MSHPAKLIKHNDRRNFIGGSDARIIMGTDPSALQRLWREKRGEAEPEDLSGNLIVQLFLDFRNIPLGAAVSVVLLAISCVIIVCYMRVLRSVEEARA